MSGGEAAEAGDAPPASSRSPLEKRLADLREEDLAQVTREDCRRFLKQKGMRRPSWNKSQAIQQVISLKSLLEGRPGAGDPPVSSFLIHSKSSSHENMHDSARSIEKEPSPYRRKDPVHLPAPAPIANPAPPCRNNDVISPENHRSVKENASTNQLTIVYDGRINVYDGVTSDKAKVIMQLAANPDNNFDSLPSTSRFPTTFSTPVAPVTDIFPPSSSGVKFPRLSKESLEELRPMREAEPECPTSRKASLQRYLEKRKDRFKGKAIIGSTCQSTMDLVYVNQKIVRSQLASNEMLINNFNNSQQIRPPQTPTRNQSENKVCFSFDLNDDACDI